MATLAARLGWGYETLMAMTTAERRLWLAASEGLAALRLTPAPLAGEGAGSTVTVGAAAGPGTPARAAPSPAAPAPAARLSTEDERRARLVELLEEMTARRRRP